MNVLWLHRFRTRSPRARQLRKVRQQFIALLQLGADIGNGLQGSNPFNEMINANLLSAFFASFNIVFSASFFSLSCSSSAVSFGLASFSFLDFLFLFFLSCPSRQKICSLTIIKLRYVSVIDCRNSQWEKHVFVPAFFTFSALGFGSERLEFFLSLTGIPRPPLLSELLLLLESLSMHWKSLSISSDTSVSSPSSQRTKNCRNSWQDKQSWVLDVHRKNEQ